MPRKGQEQAAGPTGKLVVYTDNQLNGNNFGFGLDPDCHYWNNGVDFVVRTGSVPDGGSTLALLGAALLGSGCCARSSRRS